MKKIKDLKGMFERLGNAEARAEYKRLSKAEKLYLKAIEKAGYKYHNGKILVRRKKEEIDSTSQNEYNSDEIQSSRKFSFQHQNFPGEKESGGSEAHRLAIWWASKDTVLAGDQTLISMKDNWYLVEKFDDALNQYQVEDRITKKEYDKINEEIKANGRSGKILSIQRVFTNYDKFDKLNNPFERGKSSVDSLQTQHGGEDTKLLQVDRTKSPRGQTESHGRGDSEGGGQSKQIKSSRKESGFWGDLTKKEQAQLYQCIDAFHHSNYTEYRLKSGNYLLDIENKIIETNGDFDSPSVEGYVEFNKFSSKISIARGYFYEQVNNGRTIRESVEYINEVCQEEVATLHGYDDSQNNRVVGEQGRSDSANRENRGRNGKRGAGSQTNKRAIHYNFETREITYSDGSVTKFSLKETQKINLERRGVKGDVLLDCIDLAEEILSVGGEITPAARIRRLNELLNFC